MRRECAQRTQMQFTPSRSLEDLRKSSTNSGCGHSPPSRALTHSQSLHAIAKQRRKAELQMQHARLELHQVREQLCGQHVALPSQLRQFRQELRIPQSRQSILVAHHYSLSCEISSPTLAQRASFHGQNSSKVVRSLETLATRKLARATPKLQLTPFDDPI